MNYRQLHHFAAQYHFDCGIRLVRNPDGTWFASDRNGWRLNRNGIFIGCPAPEKISNWIEDTSFSFEAAIEALYLRAEVLPQLSTFLPPHTPEPAA